MMGIKWDNLMKNEKMQFEKMNEHDRFVYFLLLQFGSPYSWGKETPEAADCSGAVCMALYAATGLLIRTTADDLLKRVFTKINPQQGDIRAVFYVTKKNQKHGDRTAAAGTATHIAGFVDDGVVLNSQEPYTRVRRINEVSDWYQRNGHEVYVRGLDREALARLAREGKTVYDLDKEFHLFFEVGA
ncbi:MAG: C40 family peptidase [Chitinispirillales bacterium]|jgi:murein DD-endopeptidase|nr:C40 family peptidase [Chitinispirillales bacterium]